MQIICTENYEEMSKVAAKEIATLLVKKPDAVLGLATGSSPIGLYENLVRWYEDGLLDFSEVKSVNLDEYRGLPADHPQSYAYFMNEHLFSKININKDNVNIPNGLAEDAAKETERYERIMQDLQGIDLQLLGLGHDGHIGFNEPSDHFENFLHRVELTETTIQANKRFFGEDEEVPTQAFTMGIGDIMRARKIVVVVSGTDKAEILKKVVEGPVTPEVPGSILQMHPDVIVVADREAAALLTK